MMNLMLPLDPVCLALFGEFDILKELHLTADDCVLIQEIILAATFMGHLNIVKWMFSEYSKTTTKFCWPSDTSLYAAKYGYSDILLFAIENGATIHQNCLQEAARHNHVDCLVVLLAFVAETDDIQKILLPIWDDLSAEIQDKCICPCSD